MLDDATTEYILSDSGVSVWWDSFFFKCTKQRRSWRRALCRTRCLWLESQVSYWDHQASVEKYINYSVLCSSQHIFCMFSELLSAFGQFSVDRFLRPTIVPILFCFIVFSPFFLFCRHRSSCCNGYSWDWPLSDASLLSDSFEDRLFSFSTQLGVMERHGSARSPQKQLRCPREQLNSTLTPRKFTCRLAM